jgi:hypothetical protein
LVLLLLKIAAGCQPLQLFSKPQEVIDAHAHIEALIGEPSDIPSINNRKRDGMHRYFDFLWCSWFIFKHECVEPHGTVIFAIVGTVPNHDDGRRSTQIIPSPTINTQF